MKKVLCNMVAAATLVDIVPFFVAHPVLVPKVGGDKRGLSRDASEKGTTIVESV